MKILRGGEDRNEVDDFLPTPADPVAVTVDAVVVNSKKQVETVRSIRSIIVLGEIYLRKNTQYGKRTQSIRKTYR